MAADHQRIHPADVEAQKPSTPLVPPGAFPSHKGDPGLAPPYPAPRRRSVPPPYKKRGGSCFCRCFCWTLLAIVLLIVLLAAAAGVLYVVLDPKLPEYSVDRLAVAAFSVSASLTASASFDVTVTADNPNKAIGIYYDRGSRLSVWYSGYSLCEGAWPEFYQGHRNTTVVTVAMAGAVRIGSGEMAALLQEEQKGAVPLRFYGEVPVRVKVGGLELWRVTSRVRCDLVVDSLTAGGRISIKSSRCNFTLKL